MYVNSDRKLIYLAHPRTASTATAHFLMDNGFTVLNSHHGRREAMFGAGWIAFTTVRNHFDTIISWATAALGTEFAKMPDEIGDTKWFSDFRKVGEPPNEYIAEHTLWHLHYEYADEILFYESLEADLERVLEMEVKLPELNVSKRRGRFWDRYYGNSSYAYVSGRFREEMRLFGYLKP